MSRCYRIPLPNGVYKFLEDEERAANLVIGGAGVVGAIAFAAAVLALAFMH